MPFSLHLNDGRDAGRWPRLVPPPAAPAGAGEDAAPAVRPWPPRRRAAGARGARRRRQQSQRAPLGPFPDGDAA